MTTRELMIGNYVMAINNYEDIFYVNCIYGYRDLNITSGIYKNYDTTIRDVKPIPLTEEWMIKFGFNKIIGKFVINPNSRYNVCVALRNNKWHLYNDDCDAECNIICEVETVHRLQNLFFDIWNFELTIKNK